MKQILCVLLCLFITLILHSQTGTSTTAKSKTKQITYKKNVNTNVVRLLPDLQIQNQEFYDPNKNNIIDADENASIKFKLQNKGEGEAQQVNIKITLLNGPVNGLIYPQNQSIGTIYPTEIKEVTIPLSGSLDIINSTAKFKIQAVEKNGLDAFPFEMEIQTKEFNKPEVVVADAVFSTEGGGKIKLNSPINLKILVQNIGSGEAKNVNAEFFLENADCIMLDADKFSVGSLKVGESRELNFIFTATRRYAFDKIPVTVALSEHYGKYGEKNL